MTEQHSTNDMTTALQQFERSLLSPVVPGELPEWSESVHRQLEEVASAVQHNIDKWHRRQFYEIERQDRELSARVEGMKQTDDEIIQQLGMLTEHCDRFAESAERREPNEASLETARKKLVEAGEKLLRKVREQELAISTWFSEAFQRDRGEVD